MSPRRNKYKRICLGRMQTSVEQNGLSLGHTEKTQALVTSAVFTQLTLFWSGSCSFSLSASEKGPLLGVCSPLYHILSSSWLRLSQASVRGSGVTGSLQLATQNCSPVAAAALSFLVNMQTGSVTMEMLGTNVDTLFPTSHFICEIPLMCSTEVLLRSPSLVSAEVIWTFTVFSFFLSPPPPLVLHWLDNLRWFSGN